MFGMSCPTIKCGVSEMPVVGLGTSQSDPGKVGRAVECAFLLGYTHIDCAHMHQNEAAIGKAFSEAFSGGLGPKRTDVFISSKLWNTFHRADQVEEACDTTLKNLQLDYLDLYLIHWPVATEPGKGTLFPVNEKEQAILDSKSPSLAETWGALEKLVEAGKCRNIGLSNFNIAQIKEVLSFAKIKPANLQIESHPHLPNSELLEFCKEHEISVTAHGPFADLLEDKTVLRIADKHIVSPAQVLIRYQLDRGNAVIPRSVESSRIEENVKSSYIFDLDKVDLARLNSLYEKYGEHRMCVGSQWKHSPRYPF